MFKTRLRWAVVLVMLAVMVLAACQPAPTPTPTPAPTPTEEPAEEVEAAEAAAEEEGAEPTEEMAAEEEAEPTEEIAAAEEEAEPTEETVAEEVEEVEPTEEMVAEEEEAEPTEEMAPQEEEMEATEVAMAEEEEMAGSMMASVMVAPDEPVVIGLAAWLSGEAETPRGEDIQRGAEIALAERPTVTVGGVEFTVEFDVQDDLCTTEGGEDAANAFVANEDVVGVVGPTCSSSCRAATPILDAAGFTSLSPSCTASDLTTDESTSFNRAVVSDALQGEIAAEYIYNELGARQIATINDGSDYGEGLIDVMTEHFEELGGEVVAADEIAVGDTDFSDLLEGIAADEPELIYFGGFAVEAAHLVEQMEDAGLEDTAFMGADGILGKDFIELAGDAAEGVYASASVPASLETFEAFLETYMETYEEAPPALYSGNAYDAVNIFLDAIETVGTVDERGDLVVDRAALSEYVRSLSDFHGVSGVYNADGTGETLVTDIGISQVIDGEYVRLATGKMAEGEVMIEPFETEEAVDEPEMEGTEEAEEAEMEPTEEADETAVDAEDEDDGEEANADVEADAEETPES